MMADGWKNLPQHILLQIFKMSSLDTIGASAQVCQNWKFAAEETSLWRSIKLVLNDRKLEETARRAIALTNKCAKNMTKLKVECIQHSNCISNMLKILKTVFENLSGSRPNLQEFELQELRQVDPKNTEMMTAFATAVNTFLEQQQRLEKFALEGLYIDHKYVKNFLEILGTSSGKQMKIITLNYSFADKPSDDFNTVISKFRNLHRLDIGYINQHLIENLSGSLGTNFTQLFITVQDLEASISDTAWVALKKSCPDLVVTFDVTGLLGAVLLTPSIPLISLTVAETLSHEFEIANIAKLYQHSLEELSIDNQYGEQELSGDFCEHLALFQRLRKFSMSMMIKTEPNIKFLKAFREILKNQKHMREVTIKYHNRRTINSGVLREMDSLKEDLKEFVDRGLVLKFILPMRDEEMYQLLNVDSNTK